MFVKFCLLLPGVRFSAAGFMGVQLSAGFGIESEMMSKMAMASQNIGKVESLTSDANEESLEQGASNQVLRNRLSSTRYHLNNMVLRIRDYTNSVELGVRSDPGWTASDADDLSQRLENPIEKVHSSMKSLGEDLAGNSFTSKKMSNSLQWVIAQGEPSIAAARAAVEDVRKKNARDAIARLKFIEDTVNGVDGVLASAFKIDS